MNKAIKYRLYPTTEQCVMFAKTFGCCRKVYNLMLSDKIRSYQETGRFVSVTPAMYKEDYPYLREVDSLALANVQLNLQRAFKACFDRSRKKRNGFPKFKSAKHSRKAYTTNNQHGTVVVMERAIKLPKIGRVKAVIHRVPDTDWILKSVTVSQEPDGRYYASVLFEYELPTDCMSMIRAIPAVTTNTTVRATQSLPRHSAGFPICRVLKRVRQNPAIISNSSVR